MNNITQSDVAKGLFALGFTYVSRTPTGEVVATNNAPTRESEALVFSDYDMENDMVRVVDGTYFDDLKGISSLSYFF